MLKLIIIFYFFFLNLFASEDYFLTLRNDKVNLRLGPSFNYPIKIIYKKKYLPVFIKEKSENFRKIQDHENNSGWIHISQLSKKKSGITIQDTILYKRSTMYSKPLAKIETGRLLLISKCKDEWCKAKTDDYKGWVKKESLWGLF
jgi:SH3-like domain-containing protein|tara:strand:- start:1641 stop:2075 length:435 start_codon:yes stop_codon:yes gene_type:complete